ncbi:uncharacterized protein V6R79_008955 [Siganus canaliculatus]
MNGADLCSQLREASLQDKDLKQTGKAAQEFIKEKKWRIPRQQRSLQATEGKKAETEAGCSIILEKHAPQSTSTSDNVKEDVVNVASEEKPHSFIESHLLLQQRRPQEETRFPHFTVILTSQHRTLAISRNISTNTFITVTICLLCALHKTK